ncbi:MAG: phospho-sugar mutase [Proteobacteria bacterium]|nr:phospho-sugar mutase [Pseudomonadota bacterium]
MTNLSITENVKYWSTHAIFDQHTREEIKSLAEKNDEKELADRFYRNLEFGTGGLRGVMAAGTNRMNIYNIRKASTALALYLKTFHGAQKPLKIGISYDSRINSKEFSMAAAEVFASHGITALITKELRPTPLLSFLVRQFKCSAGICVTASHNPAAYNGYKVYWETGAQIIPPHDKAIIKIYDSLEKYEDIHFTPYSQALKDGLIQEIGLELDDAYIAKVTELSTTHIIPKDFKIVYTPLHGNGLIPVMKTLKAFGFEDVFPVPEQMHPDGRFPTVKFPNPEDPDALQIALGHAKRLKADLVLATDPDSDRIGIIVREHESYTFFNGNQLQCLLTDFYLSQLNTAHRMPKSPLVIKTIVTTDLMNDIASEYGAHCDETLTGFKWICGRIEDYETGAVTPYRQYVCGGEESYGFLAGSFVRDKDAVSACAIASQMVATYKASGRTCTEVLEQIFRRHGLYQESLFTITLPGKDGAEAIQSMMMTMRKAPPRSIDGISCTKLLDYQFGNQSEFTSSGLKPLGILTLPKSDVLQFILEDGTKVSVRPSGTEPKIKFYVSVKDSKAKGASVAEIRNLNELALGRLVRIEQEFVKLAKG